jgi:hypothetical protein
MTTRTLKRSMLATLGALLLALTAAATAGAAWTSPTGIAGSATAPVEQPPDSAIDADGDSFFVSVNSLDQVQARVRSAATGRLGPVLKLSGGSALEPPPAAEPTVAVNARGDALFAWVSMNTAGTQHQIVCRSRTAAGALGPIQNCLAQSKDLGEILDPQVALDADGDGVIAWHQDGAASQIMFKTRTAAGRLGAVKTLAGSLNIEVTGYEVAMDNGGEAVFAYGQNTPTVEGQVYARVLSPTGTLGRAKALASPQAALGGEEGTGTQLAVNPRGDAAFTWTRTDALTGKDVIEGRVLTDDDVLKKTVKLSAGTTEVGASEVGISNTGAAVFSWTQKSATIGKSQLLGRSLSATGTLGRTQTLSGTTTDVFHGHLGVEADGDALFVWDDKDATTGKPVIQSRALTAAGALRPVVRVAALEAQPFDLQLEVAGNGKAATAWRNSGLKRVEASFGP